MGHGCFQRKGETQSLIEMQSLTSVRFRLSLLFKARQSRHAEKGRAFKRVVGYCGCRGEKRSALYNRCCKLGFRLYSPTWMLLGCGTLSHTFGSFPSPTSWSRQTSGRSLEILMSLTTATQQWEGTEQSSHTPPLLAK